MRPDALALALCCAAASAAGEIVRPVGTDATGPVVVTLDRDVYENARADLADLRVLDDNGRETPYLLARVDERVAAMRRPVMRDVGFVRGQQAMATLDFGAPTLKAHLRLSLSGDNFRRRVKVEGRGRRDTQWATLVDDAYVFAVPAPAAARYETIPLPENNYQVLRVTVFHGPDDPSRIDIQDAWIGVEEHRRPREQPLAARATTAEDAKARETVVTLDLGARHQPFRGIVVAADDARFWRGAALEARLDPPPGTSGAPLAWTFLGEGALYRMEADGEIRENLRLDVAGRHRVLRLRVRNRDDAPLAGLAVQVMAPVERLAFEAAPGRTYRLTYGDARRAAPYYDLARTAGDPQLFAARAREARLGDASVVTAAAGHVPWTERHPALLWGGLVAAVVTLGALTRKALAEA